MQFNPKALLVAMAVMLALAFAIENQSGLLAALVSALLTWGIWTVAIPERWFTRRRL